MIFIYPIDLVDKNRVSNVIKLPLKSPASVDTAEKLCFLSSGSSTFGTSTFVNLT